MMKTNIREEKEDRGWVKGHKKGVKRRRKKREQ